VQELIIHAILLIFYRYLKSTRTNDQRLNLVSYKRTNKPCILAQYHMQILSHARKIINLEQLYGSIQYTDQPV
jgi:hypothetical protein